MTAAVKLTPWFGCGTRPAREGYYDTRTARSEMVLYWDGDWWRASEFSPKNGYTWFADRQWRGLAADPSKAAK